MKHLQFAGGSVVRVGIAVSALAMLGACTVYPRAAEPIAATKPTITYAYSNDASLVDATRKAEAYCTGYNAWPRTSDIVSKPEGGRNVTFVCDQPRAGTVASTSVGVPSASPMVNYTYRDDRGLIDATNQANRYCAGFASHARSTLVASNPDGSKTISFECVRTL